MTTTAENEIISKTYQMKTDRQHVLDAPDTYIGSVISSELKTWTFEDSDDKDTMVEKNITYIEALLKLFDECIINARDHSIRMAQKKINEPDNENINQVTFIDVNITDDGTITICNDGNGIDVAKHPEHLIWIPQMIFGMLRTSTNYNKDEQKIVGGKNGYGVKLIFIWSTFGEIETLDHIRGLRYKQQFRNNMSIIEDPIIAKVKSSKSFTKITFKPDYTRLGIQTLTPEMSLLFKKRVFDIAAVTNSKIKVRYNNELVPVKNFKNYIDLFVTDKSNIVYETTDDRWEYAVSLCPNGEFTQISFVNGINTLSGGKHVDYILNKIVNGVIDYIEKKKKVKVSPSSIKEQLILFLRCDIVNPSFDSQSKTKLTTISSQFGSSCSVSDKFIEKVVKLGVMDTACKINQIKENKTIAKKTDGVKSRNITGIPKLNDANFAGTEKSKDCTLILCEGDSAKAGVLSGLSSKDKDIFGVYPLKGKMLNVRGETALKISANKEITEFKKILGLENGKVYKTIQDVHKYLRYSKILIFTDQDLDGSHIKALIINVFDSEWSSLIEIPGFISFMNTPILKAKNNSKEILFYNQGEYDTWKQDPNNLSGWKVKYYKGLGTSNAKEFKEYFKSPKMVGFNYTEECRNNIDKLFNKKRADDRKEWLKDYNRMNYLNTSTELISYKEFIDKEVIHFSKYDCDRNIPNMVDGLKTSQRKILYCAFKRNLVSEIKVAQFSGYVSEHSNYHHGEASLNGAIIGLAQNYMGSNNINLLVPSGQFGTRLANGHDHASERYIFTLLTKITKTIFNPDDNKVLNYLDDDGTIVEPLFYVPIIPMILVNGTCGIGTGFSSTVLSYNPLDIVSYLKHKLSDNSEEEYIFPISPYYEGFNGSIIPLDENGKSFMFKGRYTVIGDDKVHITELPVGLSTDKFREIIEELRETTDADGKKIIPLIKEFKDNSTDVIIDILITFQKEQLTELLGTSHPKNPTGCNNFEKKLKLYTTENTGNMHLFNEEDKLVYYEKVEDIIDAFYKVRLDYYQKRKDYIIVELEKELVILKNKVKYIENILDETIDLRHKKNCEINKMMEDNDFDKIDGDFEYLINLPMKSVSIENVDKLTNLYNSKNQELGVIKSKTIKQSWTDELGKFETEYTKFRTELIAEKTTSQCENSSAGGAKKVAKKISSKK